MSGMGGQIVKSLTEMAATGVFQSGTPGSLTDNIILEQVIAFNADLAGSFETISDLPGGAVTYPVAGASAVVMTVSSDDDTGKDVGSSGSTITGTGIAINDNGASADTITDTGNGFVTAGFAVGDFVLISGAATQDGTYGPIFTVVAGTLTFVAGGGTFSGSDAAGNSVTVADVDGAGANQVIVRGLDDSNTIVTETIILKGEDAQTTTNKFGRIFSITVSKVGSDAVSTGIIYMGTGAVTIGVPATERHRMTAASTANRSRFGVFTIPSGYAGLLENYQVVTSAAGKAQIRSRTSATAPWVAFSADVPVTTDSQIHPVSIRFAAGADIEIRGLANAATEAGDGGATIKLFKV